MRARHPIPREVWALGIVSFFMDTSSELVHAILPIFIVSTLGASKSLIGLIEGVAEAIAQVMKLLSGTLSDWSGKRKPWILGGYGLATLSKPLFPLASSVGLVAVARFADRIAKGIRGSPRDALIADVTPPEVRGAAFGLRQALDTAGAVTGPLLAALLLVLLAGDLRGALWFAMIPAVLAVVVIVFFVREPERPKSVTLERPSLRGLGRLGAGTYFATLIVGVLTLARFSEAFLLLRAQSLGAPDATIPLVLALMSVVYALSSYPAGALSDRLGRRGVLSAGIVVLVAADATLALSRELVLFALGIALWGLHMGLTQGLLAAIVADAAPPALRGTAFGLFNLVSGIALLIASVAAGLLWDSIGPEAPFTVGAIVASIAAALMILAPQRPQSVS